MKIRVKTDKTRFFFAIPTGMAAWAVRRVPEAVFSSIRRKIKDPCQQLMTKENAEILTVACVDVLKENRGLEIIRVNTSRGDFISIVL